MTTTTAPVAATVAPALRRLYFVRFGFALIWAVVLFSTASSIGPVSATLLVIYPLFDVGAAIVDARSSRASRSALGLYVNIAISVIAAVGLVFAVASGIPAVLRVWGVWAVAAGLVQLVVALRRRKLGGQWAMIASGTISTLAGTSFFLQGRCPSRLAEQPGRLRAARRSLLPRLCAAPRKERQPEHRWEELT